jgi:hypothetical protein
MTASVTPRTRSIVLLQGEDEEELDTLRDRAAELRQKADSLKPKQGQRPAAVGLLTEGDDSSAAEAAAVAAEKAADDFAAAAALRGVKVIMRSLGRKKWRDILKNHPPREGDAQDRVARYNVDTAPEDIVPACLASPALADAEREEFLDSLTDGQFQQIAWLAHIVNQGVGADPTQRLLSTSSQTSDETSSSPSAPA